MELPIINLHRRGNRVVVVPAISSNNVKPLQLLLEDLIPLIQRFPELPVNNVSYNRNIVELMFNLYGVEQKIACHLKPLRVQKSMRIGLRYQEHGKASFDSARLSRLERLLRDDYLVLHKYLGGFFHSIESDLRKIKRSTDFDSLAKKLIRISPLIYNAAGHALSTCHYVASLTQDPEQLQQLYYDSFYAHLSSQFIKLSERQGYGEVKRFVGNVCNQFIPKEVIPATTRYTSNNQQVTERELFLEEVPPLYSIFRGALARDCSMLTVPYFSVLENTRVFWVSRSTGEKAKPCGYLFVAEVLVNDVLLPYLITINGPNLKEMDCKAICYLLQNIYSTQTVLIADVRGVSYLVNSPSIKNAMAELCGHKVSVEMPPGWQAISDWTENTIAFQNYYEQSRLARPGVVASEKVTLFNPRIIESVQENFYPGMAVQEVSLINRTLIAYFFLRAQIADVSEKVLMQMLELHKEHLQHSDVVINVYQEGAFKVDSFKVLNSYFGFSIEDYARLPFSVRVDTLAELYQEYGADPAISRQQWSDVIRKTFDEIKAMADEGFERNNRDTIMQQMASIPDEFIKEYWDVTSSCFILNENKLDYFLLGLAVNYFRSLHTVTKFLEFLDKHPEAIEAVKPEDPRWFNYLARASAIIAQHEALPRVFQKVFHDLPLDTEISMSAYEVEKRYQAARDLGWEFSESLVKTVFEKRGWL